MCLSSRIVGRDYLVGTGPAVLFPGSAVLSNHRTLRLNNFYMNHVNQISIFPVKTQAHPGCALRSGRQSVRVSVNPTLPDKESASRSHPL